MTLHDYLDEQEQVTIKNDFKICGDTTIIYLRRLKGNLVETLVDTKDLGKLSKVKHRWSAQWDEHTQSFYVRTWSSLMLHRYLMDCPEGLQVDHINHDTLDNRRSNLRIVTLTENLQNISGKYRNNTSGIRGVDFKNGKWRARVQVNKKPIHLGYFDDRETAKKAAAEARIKYFPHSKEAMQYE